VDGWTIDDSVTVSTSTDAAGTRLHVLHNWSWEEATASPSVTLTDVLGGGRHTPGEPVTLVPWDVQLFRDVRSTMNG
jgi:beta-galactosidase